MLEVLFTRDWPLYAAGPQGPLVRNFATWVIERGYTRISAKCHVRRFREVLAYNRVSASPRPIASVTLARWFAPWSDESLYRATQRVAARFLTDQGSSSRSPNRAGSTCFFRNTVCSLLNCVDWRLKP